MATGNLFKNLVSKEKRRYKKGGYDLDLTYIVPNIIAMGFPSEKLEGWYRNRLDDVFHFLEDKHPGRYKMYNLCSERYYEPGKFLGRVALFPFDDHNAPPYELIEPFCDDIDAWLTKNPENVAAVHCKDGKGRTGVMICAYLLYKKKFESAQEVLAFYGEARTRNNKGVTIPSQRRYVYYFGYALHNPLRYSIKTFLLRKFRFEGIPSFATGGGCSVSFVVWLASTKVFTSKLYEFKKGDNVAEIVLHQDLLLSGDVRIEFYHSRWSSAKEKMFQFWFNTFFVPWHMQYQAEEEKRAAVEVPPMDYDIIFPKDELDKANKDKKRYPPNFKLHMILSPCDCQPSQSQTSSNSSETGDGPPQNIPEPSISAPKEEENLSDTDSESEWETSELLK